MRLRRLSDLSFDSILAIFLFVLSTWTILDLMFEDPDDLNLSHLVIEGGIFLTSLAAFLFLLGRVRSAQTAALTASHQLHLKNEEAAVWKKKAAVFVEGLGKEIQLQFGRWQLTPTECEVALMLIKGFSHQEIARIFGRSERTVRQHAGVVYQKSGLTGRAELAAFFLEDLLSPGDTVSTPDLT